MSLLIEVKEYESFFHLHGRASKKKTVIGSDKKFTLNLLPDILSTSKEVNSSEQTMDDNEAEKPTTRPRPYSGPLDAIRKGREQFGATLADHTGQEGKEKSLFKLPVRRPTSTPLQDAARERQRQRKRQEEDEDQS